MNDRALDTVLLRTTEGGVATLVLNRPKQYNALSGALLAALDVELDAIAADDSVRVVIVTGAGNAFCAGHDLREMRALPAHADVERLFGACSAMMQKIVAIPQPVIAAVNGLATAAGCQLVAQCDLAVAAEHAHFAVSGVNLGLFCSTPAVALTRNVGRKRAAEMLFTGDFVSAQTALQWGLVNRVVPAARNCCRSRETRSRSARRSSTASSKSGSRPRMPTHRRRSRATWRLNPRARASTPSSKSGRRAGIPSAGSNRSKSRHSRDEAVRTILPPRFFRTRASTLRG
jgi:enoyl-CoA hydratase/carnithine racemase